MTIAPQDMVLFAAVVREGGFTAAARALAITKQSASARVARLEAQLGVRLLERSTRRVRPTEAGAAYFERCSAIATQIEEANREVLDRQRAPAGLLRISVPYLFGRRFLTPIITTYRTRYPAVHVEVLLGDRRVNLIEEGFDLAIRAGTLDDSSLSATSLGDVRVAALASPRFLARTRLGSPRELRDEHCIGARPVETWQLAGTQVRIRPHLVVNDLELARDAAIAGLGVALLPSLVLGTALTSGQLREAWPGSMTPVHAIFPTRTLMPAKVRAFLELLVTRPGRSRVR